MERPLMNPMFLGDMEGPPPPKKSLLRRIFGLPGALGRLLLADVFFWRGNRLKIEDGGIFNRLIHLLCYRILFAPLALVLVVGLLVYMGTHPPRSQVVVDARSW